MQHRSTVSFFSSPRSKGRGSDLIKFLSARSIQVKLNSKRNFYKMYRRVIRGTRCKNQIVAVWKLNYATRGHSYVRVLSVDAWRMERQPPPIRYRSHYKRGKFGRRRGRARQRKPRYKCTHYTGHDAGWINGTKVYLTCCIGEDSFIEITVVLSPSFFLFFFFFLNCEERFIVNTNVYVSSLKGCFYRYK